MFTNYDTEWIKTLKKWHAFISFISFLHFLWRWSIHSILRCIQRLLILILTTKSLFILEITGPSITNSFHSYFFSIFCDVRVCIWYYMIIYLHIYKRIYFCMQYASNCWWIILRYIVYIFLYYRGFCYDTYVLLLHS